MSARAADGTWIILSTVCVCLCVCVFTFRSSSAVSPSAHRPADEAHHAESSSRMSRCPCAARLLSPASPPRCLCSPIGNWHILLHCSSGSGGSTCSDRLTHLLHLFFFFFFVKPFLPRTPIGKTSTHRMEGPPSSSSSSSSVTLQYTGSH